MYTHTPELKKQHKKMVKSIKYLFISSCIPAVKPIFSHMFPLKFLKKDSFHIVVKVVMPPGSCIGPSIIHCLYSE